MLTKEIIAKLSSKKLIFLLEQIDTQAVWEFDENECSLIAAMLYSDSNAAFGKASFIISENIRHAGPLIPTILDISSSKGIRGRRLLIDLISSKYMVWCEGFLQCVTESLYADSAHMRAITIRLVLKKFIDIFPSVFTSVIDEKYVNLPEAKLSLEREYKKDIKKVVNVERGGVADHYFDFFMCRKRLIRSLYIISLVKEKSIQEARNKISDEDSFVFDDLEYRYKLSNNRWK